MEKALILQNVKRIHEGNRFDDNIKSKHFGISKINVKGNWSQPHVIRKDKYK